MHITIEGSNLSIAQNERGDFEITFPRTENASIDTTVYVDATCTVMVTESGVVIEA